MDSAQHCRDQSAECRRLMKLAQSEAEAEVLRNLSISWARLAGQIDRYNAIVREQGRPRFPDNLDVRCAHSGNASPNS
jgi:hypothetical protein